MKKSRPIGYQAIPARSQSPLERGASAPKDNIARRSAGPVVPGPVPGEARRPARGPPATKPIAPGQPAPPGRVRERFVSLPEDLPSASAPPAADGAPHPTIFEDLPADPSAGLRGRISIYCIAESLDRVALEKALTSRGDEAFLHDFPDALHGRWRGPGDAGPSGDVFYFDYGVVVFWGLSQRAEAAALATLALPVAVDRLPPREVELDEFEYHYTSTERAHIQNDTFTIHYRASGDHLLKLSVSHALAQSTKLSVYEQRVVEIVESTKDLPERLATTGRIDMSRKSIAQLIGRVFIQKSAVNLLSTVLDTPEFFWSAPDALQELYKRVGEYMEYDTRVEVLNMRFQVLQEMLDMLRDHQNNFHGVRLEWIVIWLIAVEVVVGLFECASILGWVGNHE